MQKAAAGVAPVLAGEEDAEAPAVPTEAGTQTEGSELPSVAPEEQTFPCRSQAFPSRSPQSSSESLAAASLASEPAAATALDAAAAAAAARVAALQERYDQLKHDSESQERSWGIFSPVASLGGRILRAWRSGATGGPVPDDVANVWQGLPPAAEHRGGGEDANPKDANSR
jgi:hypothetical protein